MSSSISIYLLSYLLENTLIYTLRGYQLATFCAFLDRLTIFRYFVKHLTKVLKIIMKIYYIFFASCLSPLFSFVGYALRLLFAYR